MNTVRFYATLARILGILDSAISSIDLFFLRGWSPGRHFEYDRSWEARPWSEDHLTLPAQQFTNLMSDPDRITTLVLIGCGKLSATNTRPSLKMARSLLLDSYQPNSAANHDGFTRSVGTGPQRRGVGFAVTARVLCGLPTVPQRSISIRHVHVANQDHDIGFIPASLVGRDRAGDFVAGGMRPR